MAKSVTTVHGSETGVTVVVTLILTTESGSLVGLPFRVISKICRRRYVAPRVYRIERSGPTAGEVYHTLPICVASINEYNQAEPS